MFNRYRSVGGLRARVTIPDFRALPASVLAVLVSGCALQPPATIASGPPSPEPVSRSVPGEWEDVDAAVRTAVRRAQMAIESQRSYRSGDGGEVTAIEYDLLTVRGDTGLLRVRRLPGPRVGLHVRIGALGSAEAERRVADDLESRLADLLGRDFAPLRE